MVLKKRTEVRCRLYRRGSASAPLCACSGVSVEAAVVREDGSGREEEQMLPAWLRLTLWHVSLALSECWLPV